MPVAMWIFYSLIMLWGIEMVIKDLGMLGVFGRKYQTYSAFGKVNKTRDLQIQKCIAFCSTGKYKAVLTDDDKFMLFLNVDDYTKWGADEDAQRYSCAYAYNVENWNNELFGKEAGRTYYSYKTDMDEGTISYETRKLLVVLKHELQGTELEIDESIFRNIFKDYKKEVTLS